MIRLPAATQASKRTRQADADGHESPSTPCGGNLRSPPVWTAGLAGLDLGSVREPPCAACASGGACPSCGDRPDRGNPLEPADRDFFENTLGPLGDVRLHTDARAASSAASLNASALTVGRDVMFAAGAYAPATPAGRRLLAHELAHVVTPGPVDGGGGITEPSDAVERQADRVAAAALTGQRPPPVPVATGAGLPVVARQVPTPPPPPCGSKNRPPGDPTYAFRGTLEHVLVQIDFFATRPQARAEYFIPESSSKKNNNDGFADCVNLASNEIFEIKPQHSEAQGAAEVGLYVTKANQFCGPATWTAGAGYTPNRDPIVSGKGFRLRARAGTLPGTILYFWEFDEEFKDWNEEVLKYFARRLIYEEITGNKTTELDTSGEGKQEDDQTDEGGEGTKTPTPYPGLKPVTLPGGTPANDTEPEVVPIAAMVVLVIVAILVAILAAPEAATAAALEAILESLGFRSAFAGAVALGLGALFEGEAEAAQAGPTTPDPSATGPGAPGPDGAGDPAAGPPGSGGASPKPGAGGPKGGPPKPTGKAGARRVDVGKIPAGTKLPDPAEFWQPDVDRPPSAGPAPTTSPSGKPLTAPTRVSGQRDVLREMISRIKRIPGGAKPGAGKLVIEQLIVIVEDAEKSIALIGDGEELARVLGAIRQGLKDALAKMREKEQQGSSGGGSSGPGEADGGGAADGSGDGTGSEGDLGSSGRGPTSTHGPGAPKAPLAGNGSPQGSRPRAPGDKGPSSEDERDKDEEEKGGTGKAGAGAGSGAGSGQVTPSDPNGKALDASGSSAPGWPVTFEERGTEGYSVIPADKAPASLSILNPPNADAVLTAAAGGSGWIVRQRTTGKEEGTAVDAGNGELELTGGPLHARLLSGLELFLLTQRGPGAPARPKRLFFH